MNPGSESNRLRRKPEHNLLECLGRIRDPDLGVDDLFCEILWNKGRRSPRLAKGREVTRIAVKRDLARGRLRERSRAGDR